MEFSLFDLLLSFAGGVFGAAIGALPVWILCGLAVLIGSALNASSSFDTFTNVVGWGHFIGPHTAFVGGTGAAAYAARKGQLDQGRNILVSLMGLNNPKVLLIGGLFGSLGYVFLYLACLVPDYTTIPWTNHIALAVILGMVAIRLTVGKTGLFGKVKAGASRWKVSEVASWVPYQSKPGMIAIISFSVALASAHLVMTVPNSIGIIFGFVAFLLIFMQFGFNVPVTHHIALTAAFATLITGSPIWGVSMGLMTGLVAEYIACLFVYHGDTHIDPPTMAILFTFTLVPFLNLLGILELSTVLVVVIGIAINMGLFMLLKYLKKESNSV